MRRFSKSDIKFMKAVGIATKGLRPARECRIECVQILEPSFAEQRMELARRIAKHTPPGIPSPCPLRDAVASRVLQLISEFDEEQLQILRDHFEEIDRS